MKIIPVQFKEACAFVDMLHRHHKKPQGHKFSIAATASSVKWDNEEFLNEWPEMLNVVGVAIVGRPVSRHMDDGQTLEITRLCTDGTRNACSFLYAHCWKIAQEKGFTKIITYILESESGKSVEAAGFKFMWRSTGGSWSSKVRPRIDKHPTVPKQMYQIQL